MKLRPHHLMCTQGYSGKGYSKDFVENMNNITDILRNNKDVKINLVFFTDDICISCPEKLEEDLCSSNNKIKSIDEKVVRYFNLEEKEYNYKKIVKYIKDNMTEEIMDDICSTCQWYHMSKCKEVMCSDRSL